MAFTGVPLGKRGAIRRVEETAGLHLAADSFSKCPVSGGAVDAEGLGKRKSLALYSSCDVK